MSGSSQTKTKAKAVLTQQKTQELLLRMWTRKGQVKPRDTKCYSPTAQPLPMALFASRGLENQP